MFDTYLVWSHLSAWAFVLFFKEKFHVQKQQSSENPCSIIAHLIIKTIKKSVTYEKK